MQILLNNKDFIGIYQYYVYDDKGDRIIKYNLNEGSQLYQNGVLVDGGSIAISGSKIYPNPYVTIDENHTFTKHYYAGDKRVASRIGDADFTTMKQANNTKMPDKKDLPDPEKDMKIYLEKAGIDFGSLTTELSKKDGPQPNVYYLHGDHLGTATFVTEQHAEATQFFLNLPFGETMAEQMTGVYDNPYKFNAKELDSETGLYYYGARYYNPRLSVWYGVDSKAEKYTNWSPYNYTLGNPVNLIDPDGRAVTPPDDIYKDRNGKEIYRVKKDVDRTFIVKTTETNHSSRTDEANINSISRKDANMTEDLIRKGNLEGAHMNNVIQIANANTQKAMLDYVSSKDDGSGNVVNTATMSGFKPGNFSEHGGKINADGSISPVQSGSVVLPNNASVHGTMTEDVDFHTHSSGQISIMKGSILTSGGSIQMPSSYDVSYAGEGLKYEFGMRSKEVYIYNKTGVVSIIPFKILVNK